MQDHGERARALFAQGYNCSQSVAAAFAQELGLPQQTVLAMSMGFGGGMGRMRQTCGAFSGMVLVLGLYYGLTAPQDKSRVYGAVQQLAQGFREFSGGSLLCGELLGAMGRDTSPQASARTTEYYQKRPCKELVGRSAELLAAYLQQHPTL